MGEFARLLTIKRDMRKWSLHDICERTGIKSTCTVSYWLNGKTLPGTEETCVRVARMLDIDEDQLLDAYYHDMEGRDQMKKPLYKEVSESELRTLRAEGLTNKQIAERIGCSVPTVYKIISKRSADVQKAAEQNKPCPVSEFAKEVTGVRHLINPNNPEPIMLSTTSVNDKMVEAETPVVEKPVIETKPEEIAQKPVREIAFVNDNGNMPILNAKYVVERQGSVCVFKVDSEADYVELLDRGNGQLSGIVEYRQIPNLIRDLQYLYSQRSALEVS